jgi:hypothetical protein
MRFPSLSSGHASISWNYWAKLRHYHPWRVLGRAVATLGLSISVAGCGRYVFQPPLLRTPLAPELPVADQKPGSEVLLSSLGQIVTLDSTRSVLSSRSLLSMYNIPIESTSVADVIDVTAPQLEPTAALRLMGIEAGTASAAIGEKKVESNASDEFAAIEIEFADITDQTLDRRSLAKLLRSGAVAQNQMNIPTPSKAVPNTSTSSTAPPNSPASNVTPPIYSYLVTEVRSARRVSILLPSTTGEALVNALKADPRYQQKLAIAPVGKRWRITGPLDQPRTVAVGITVLKAHHSKTEHLAAVPQSQVETAVALGWIDSLPQPTDVWYSTPPADSKSTMTEIQARAFLDKDIKDSGMPTGTAFTLKRGLGTVTSLEFLKDASSTELLVPRFSAPSHLKSLLCFPWDCSLATSREFVLAVGHSPDISLRIPSTTLSADYVRYLQREPSPAESPLAGTTCYALVYVYNEHWSGRREIYTLSQTGNLAKAHLSSAQLKGLLQCH